MRKAAPINVIVHPFFVFIMPQVKHLLSYFMLKGLFSSMLPPRDIPLKFCFILSKYPKVPSGELRKNHFQNNSPTAQTIAAEHHRQVGLDQDCE